MLCNIFQDSLIVKMKLRSSTINSLNVYPTGYRIIEGLNLLFHDFSITTGVRTLNLHSSNLTEWVTTTHAQCTVAVKPSRQVRRY